LKNLWKKKKYQKLLKKEIKKKYNKKKFQKLENYYKFLYFFVKTYENEISWCHMRKNKKKMLFFEYNNDLTLYGIFFQFYYNSLYKYLKNLDKKNFHFK
jgi:hypothetical protein